MDKAAEVKPREAEFFIRRHATMPNNHAMEINISMFVGEDEKACLARLAKAERMMDLVSYRQQILALEENIKATQIQLQNELDVLEDLQRKLQGTPNNKLKPNEQNALAQYPKQIEAKKQGLLIMENRVRELKELTKDFK